MPPASPRVPSPRSFRVISIWFIRRRGDRSVIQTWLKKALNLQPRRTIRVALWTGHEQGGLGSNAYVQRHLRDWVRQSQGDLSTRKPQ